MPLKACTRLASDFSIPSHKPNKLIKNMKKKLCLKINTYKGLEVGGMLILTTINYLNDQNQDRSPILVGSLSVKS